MLIGLHISRAYIRVGLYTGDVLTGFCGIFFLTILVSLTCVFHTREYDRLRSEALIVSPVLPLPAPSTLSIALLNSRSLRWHPDDIASDFRRMNNDALLLTETQLSSDSDLDEIKNLLDKLIFSFNMNGHRFSSLAICHQNSAYIQRNQKGNGISTISFYKPIYASDGIGVALMYRRQLSSGLKFHSKLEHLNNSQETIILMH